MWGKHCWLTGLSSSCSHWDCEHPSAGWALGKASAFLTQRGRSSVPPFSPFSVPRTSDSAFKGQQSYWDHKERSRTKGPESPREPRGCPSWHGQAARPTQAHLPGRLVKRDEWMPAWLNHCAWGVFVLAKPLYTWSGRNHESCFTDTKTKALRNCDSSKVTLPATGKTATCTQLSESSNVATIVTMTKTTYWAPRRYQASDFTRYLTFL